MNRNSFIAALAVSAFGVAAQAQDTGDFVVGGGLSTFGANLEAGYYINPQLRLRGAVMGGISADFEETDTDGVTVKGDFNLGGAALLADYYPTGGAWRISGGLFLSNTELTASGEVDLGSFGDEEATVSAEFANEISPMVTAGYEYKFGRGWSFNSEIGVLFTGGIDVVFTATDPSAQAEIDADTGVQDLISDASDLVVYPYLSFGVTYAF